MPYIDVNDIHLYYEEQGSGQPNVLLHGGTGTIDSDSGWRRLRPALAEHYRAIFVEHRGHGRTDNPAERISYEMIADDVCTLIDRLDLAPTHIAGMSDGGIAVPTLLIAGDNDPFGNLDQMAAMKRNIPRSELLIVNNAGHIVQDTHPDIVGPVMLEFLSRAQSQ